MRPDSSKMSRACQALLPMLIAAGMAGCGGAILRLRPLRPAVT